MANAEHLQILKRGLHEWHKWRKSNWSIEPDLSGADLSNAELRNADFRATNLAGANLYNAFCPGATLIRANLQNANLIKTDLVRAEISLANLQHADLSGALLISAKLLSADLSYAKLVGARLFEAKLASAKFRGADLTRADLSFSDLMDADLSQAQLVKTDLMVANLLRTNLEGARLSGCFVHGASVWKVKVNDDTTQTNLVITDPIEPTITTDDLEVAQFIYLLLNHRKLRNAIDSITRKGVLLLGRFAEGGLEVLHAIAAELRSSQYLPIIFDFDQPQDRNITETVKTLVGLSRFVIVELSGPSVPQELYATVPHYKIPFVPIIEAGRKPYAMVGDILEYPWVVNPIIEYGSLDELKELVSTKIVSEAEKKLKERRRKKN